MAEFGATLEETFRTTASPVAARAHFADLERIRDAITEGERFEPIGDGRMRIFLKPQHHGATTFHGRYTVRYATHEDEVVWATEGEGNVVSRGRARFRADEGGTVIAYRHDIALDLPVNRVVAKVLSPVVAQITKRSLRQYVARLIASLENRPPEVD